MGLFKRLPNRRHAAHGGRGTAAQARRDDSPALAPATALVASVSAADLEPIADVTLDTYATICRQAATTGVDEDGVISLAREHRVNAVAWQAASEGWAERFKGNVPLAVHYGNVYRAI